MSEPYPPQNQMPQYDPSRIQNNPVSDFLQFKKMITPVIIQIVFWIGVVGSITIGLGAIVTGISERGSGIMVFFGLLYIVLGPIFVRVYCELLIVIFAILDRLAEIRDLLKNKTPM